MKIKEIFRISIFSFIFILLSCKDNSRKDNNFLNIEDAQKFSKSAPLSAREARKILENYLNKVNRSSRKYSKCYVRDGEYYFLRLTPYLRSTHDGYKINAINGMIQRVHNYDIIKPPYASEEQQLLFVSENESE